MTAAVTDPDLIGITRVAAQICGAASAAINLVGSAVTGPPPLCEVPLHGRDGALLGTLCVFDDEVHGLDARQRAALDDLARQVVQVLELRAREHDLLDAVGELLRSNDELAAFAGRVSHDLRSPLTAVLGFLALVDGPFRDETSERARECVSSALDAARRMRRLVDDLLAYASPDVQPALQTIRLPDLMREVTDDLAAEIRRAGATVRYTGAEVVLGDPTLLRQLLQNLIGNALKHGGTAPLVTAHAVVDAAEWRLEVSDDGPGVPADQRARIFDPFVRLASAGSSGGSGIGLATCARIADVLGGGIEVLDAPGGGATFRVTLPL